MNIFAELRERYKIIKFLVEAQKSIWYPIVFAALGTISALNGYRVYLPLIYLLISFLVFSALFTDDTKVMLTPIIMLFFTIGLDKDPSSYYDSKGDLLSLMEPFALKHYIALGIIGVCAIFFRLISDGSIAEAFKKHRHFTFGVIALDIAFMLNGIFSSKYDFSNIFYGFVIAGVFTAVYAVAAAVVERSENVISYVCLVKLLNSCSILLQVLITVLRAHEAGNWISYYPTVGYAHINGLALALGWGVQTNIGTALVLGIPAAMYLAKNSRSRLFCVFCCFSSALFIVGTILINSRSSMLVSIPVFILCITVCIFKGKRRSPFIVSSVLCLALGSGALIYITKNIMPLDVILSMLRIDKIMDSGRFALWKNGIEDFKSSPIFGVGFFDGAYPPENKPMNFHANMYHCILFEFPAAMGIVGCFAFLIHLYECAVILFKRFTSNKLFLMLINLMIIGMSLFDNFFFYPVFQIFYGVFLTVIEKYTEESENSQRLSKSI